MLASCKTLVSMDAGADALYTRLIWAHRSELIGFCIAAISSKPPQRLERIRLRQPEALTIDKKCC